MSLGPVFQCAICRKCMAGIALADHIESAHGQAISENEHGERSKGTKLFPKKGGLNFFVKNYGI